MGANPRRQFARAPVITAYDQNSVLSCQRANGLRPVFFFQGCGHRSGVTIKGFENKEIVNRSHTHNRFRDHSVSYDSRDSQFTRRLISTAALNQAKRMDITRECCLTHLDPAL